MSPQGRSTGWSATSHEPRLSNCQDLWIKFFRRASGSFTALMEFSEQYADMKQPPAVWPGAARFVCRYDLPRSHARASAASLSPSRLRHLLH